MEVLFIVGMIIRVVIQLVMSIFGKVLASPWLSWIEKRFSKAIVTSDFRINFVTEADPPRLQFIFEIHNGAVSAVNLKEIAVNLYSADAYITGIAGSISDISLVSVPSTKVGKGKEVEIVIDIVPSLEFWLPPRTTSFSLRKSSIIISTFWGDIAKPLEPDLIQDNTREFEKQIDEYIAKVRRSLSIQ
ncbi:MAG: hypothetical protein JSV77_01725 [Dehalococcoidales bacterium]|nr:MAG: hypothetical protein JSV77_01725 [Dehalococcoidales bacterium]